MSVVYRWSFKFRFWKLYVVSKLRSRILLILGEFCLEIDDYKIYTFSGSVDLVLLSIYFHS